MSTIRALVEDRWASFIVRHGLAVTASTNHTVTLDSASVRVEVAHDPRGEIDICVSPHGQGTHGQWQYAGMVGRASAARLLDIVVEKMESEPAILQGDPAFFNALAQEQRADSAAWTAYYQGRGPRSGKPHLP